jgi:hypothetical protein
MITNYNLFLDDIFVFECNIVNEHKESIKSKRNL